MLRLPVLVALCAVSSSVLAQAACSAGPSPPLSMATMNPFAGTSLYGHPGYPTLPGPTFPGFSYLFDVTANVGVDFTSFDFDFYDAGGLVDLGNGTYVTSPDQVGATAPVTFYMYPGASWVGNEQTPAIWGVLGTGTLTVAAPHSDSTVVFNPPIHLPPGLWAVALQVPQTTNGPNPGPLHPMVAPTTPPPAQYADGAITITNLRFQRESWTNLLASAGHTQSIEFHYTAGPGYANWTSFGTGCPAASAAVLGLTARPVVGTTLDFQATSLPASTSFCLWLFGFQPDPIGMDLTPFGVPGCSLYLQFGSPMVTGLSAVTGGAAGDQIPLPNDPSYVGVVLFAQAAPLSITGFGATNGVCVAFGSY